MMFRDSFGAMVISPRNALVLFVLIASAGMVTAMYTTRTGPGVTPDSVQYLYAARTFLEGRGFLSLYDEGGEGALTHFPPGYPMALALASLFTPGGSLTSAGTGLSILLWGMNLFLVMWLVHRHTGRPLIALGLGILLVTSLDLHRIHEMVWSEPLFFLLSLLALWKTAEYCDQQRVRDLAIAIVCMALAGITRYIGVVLIASLALIMMLRSQGTLLERFKRTALTGALGALPLLVWLVRGKLVANTMTNRSLGYHPMTADYWNDLLETLGEFVLQVLQLKVQSQVAGFLLMVLCLFLVIRHRRSLVRRARENTFAFSLLCCNIGYFLFLMVSNTFLDRTPLYYRIIYPVLVQLMIGIVLIAAPWAEKRLQVGGKKKYVLAFAVLYSVTHMSDHLRYVIGKNDPNGYFAAVWTTDPVLAHIQEHPSEPVCSNAIDVLYIHTGRILPQLGALVVAPEGTSAAVFAGGSFNTGRSFAEDLAITNPYAPGVQLELVMESPASRLYRSHPRTTGREHQ